MEGSTQEIQSWVVPGERVEQGDQMRRPVQPAEDHGLESLIPSPSDGGEADRVGMALGQAGRVSDGKRPTTDPRQDPTQGSLALHQGAFHPNSVVVSSSAA
jgi:hypothetical protein